jgi:hypothetical protein
MIGEYVSTLMRRMAPCLSSRDGAQRRNCETGEGGSNRPSFQGTASRPGEPDDHERVWGAEYGLCRQGKEDSLVFAISFRELALVRRTSQNPDVGKHRLHCLPDTGWLFLRWSCLDKLHRTLPNYSHSQVRIRQFRSFSDPGVSKRNGATSEIKVC